MGPVAAKLVSDSTLHSRLGIYVRGSSTMCIDFRGIGLGWKESSRTRLATAPRAIDFAIMTSDAQLSDSDSMLRWSERILLVLPESPRLASCERVCWTDLRGEKRCAR